MNPFSSALVHPAAEIEVVLACSSSSLEDIVLCACPAVHVEPRESRSAGTHRLHACMIRLLAGVLHAPFTAMASLQLNLALGVLM